MPSSNSFFRTHRRHARFNWLPSLVTLAFAPALFAASQSFDGSTVNQPTFNRPNESGSALSGNLVPYHAQGFQLVGADTCDIYSAQSYDGFIHLYQGGFVVGSPLSNLLTGDDDGNLGPGTSELRNVALTAGSYTIVTSGVGAGDSGQFQTTVHCSTSQPIHGRCFVYLPPAPKEQQTCVHDRFTETVTNISNHPSNGIGTPVRFGSNDSSLFWFYKPSNFELMVKVLNGCGINDRYWVFIGGLTNQAYTLRVHDNVTGLTRSYSNTLGTRAPAVTDTDAFDCTP